MIIANSLKDWVKRYWLWVVIGGLIILVILVKLLPTGDRGMLKQLHKAERKAIDLLKAKREELTDLETTMDNRLLELKRIREIEDEFDKAKALAEFTNKAKK